MGNFPDSDKQFLDDWVQLEKEGSPGTYTNIWLNKRGNQKMEIVEHPLHVSSEDEIDEERRIFALRLNHPQLVSSVYFLDESVDNFCGSNFQGNIFIERIPLTLQTITDIPFPDALHVYSQSLIGFQVLTTQILNTCFPISQQHIGINCESVCKVWMNVKHDKNFPTRNENIHQHLMVKMILEIIEAKIDITTLKNIPTPLNYIYSRSRSPNEVRFDEAISILQTYANQFFGGRIPQKMSCVERVGGVFTLSKNWKTKFESIVNAAISSNQHPQNLVTPSQSLLNSVQANSNPVLTRNNTQPIQTYKPQTVENVETVIRRDPPLGQLFNSGVRDFSLIQRNNNTVSTLALKQNGEQSIFPNKNTQIPNPNQQSRVIQQIINQPQMIRNPSQRTINYPLGSRVLTPVNNPTFPGINPRFFPVASQIPQGVIQNRVPFNPSQPIPSYQNNQPVFIQRSAQTVGLQQIPQSFSPNQNTQPVLFQPVSHPTFIPNNAFSQQINVGNQGPTTQVRIPPPGVLSQNGEVRRSNILVENQGVSTPAQVTSNPYQATQTTSVFVTPHVINKNQKSQMSANVVEEKEKPTNIQNGTVGIGMNETNMHLLQQTQEPNQVQSNEQISDKFSITKEEPVDLSTKNFYNNMANNQVFKGGNDYFSSYYANYTSKLYENQKSAERTQYQPNNQISSTSNVLAKEVQPDKEQKFEPLKKYKVNVDDGMSSATFLEQIKNMKLSNNNLFKKTQNNFDYVSTYDFKNEGNKNAATSDQDIYKFQYKNYMSSNDGLKRSEIPVINSKVDLVPQQNSQKSSFENTNQYKFRLQSQEASYPLTTLKLQSQQIKLTNSKGSSQEQYQSIFQKYASFDKYVNQSSVLASNVDENFRLGENLRTQFSRKQEEQQFFQTTKNTMNNTSYSPLQQKSEEEYKVEFDPEILADLQRIKG